MMPARDDGKHARQVPGDRALADVRESSWLARGLEPYLLDSLDIVAFSCWTFADAEVTDERLAELKTGGPVCTENASELAGAEVAETLDECNGGAFIAPDPMRRPGDAFLDRLPLEYFTVDDGIYYVERRPDRGRILDVWRHSGSAAGQIGIVSRHTILATPTEADLHDIMAAVQLIVVTASDGDGTLFVTRPVGTA
jgi:hypothetical protein